MILSALAAASGFVLGAIVGSFMATLVVRWPQGRSVTAGRSACDRCGSTLFARDLVPIISGLVLRGRCRRCGAGIDSIHGRIELAAASIGAVSLGLSPNLAGLAAATLGFLLLALAMLDWRHFWLPDRLVLVLALAGLAGGRALGVTPTDQLIGGASGFAALALLGAAYRRLRGRIGLGQGDPKLMGAIGLWLGWQSLAPLLALAAAAGLVLAIATGRRAQDSFPFGTMLAAAAWPIALVHAV